MVLGCRRFGIRRMAWGWAVGLGSASGGLGQVAVAALVKAVGKSLLHHLPAAGRHHRRHRPKARVREREQELGEEEGVLEDSAAAARPEG
jgi:hypothetical protein